MPQVTRRLEFDYGHRVLGHEGKCRYLHGHRGVALITVSSLGLDTVGRVIDFGVIKDVVGKWVDENFDHNFLANPDDPILECLKWKDCRTAEERSCGQDEQCLDYGREVFGGKAPFIMPRDAASPTAENIAKVLYLKAKELLDGRGLSVDYVEVFETPNCSAKHPS